MLSRSQFAMLIALGIFLWGAAAALIRLFPGVLLDPLLGGLAFVVMAVAACVSVFVIKRVARFSDDQLATGVCVIGAVAMTIDGAMLRWVPAWPFLPTCPCGLARPAAEQVVQLVPCEGTDRPGAGVAHTVDGSAAMKQVLVTPE